MDDADHEFVLLLLKTNVRPEARTALLVRYGLEMLFVGQAWVHSSSSETE